MNGTNVIEERNVFVDSEQNRILDGTQFEYNFPGAVFSCNPPEKQSLTVEQFCMPKVWSNVNPGNSIFFLCAQPQNTHPQYPKLLPLKCGSIEKGDYYSWDNGSSADLANKLQDVIQDALDLNAAAATYVYNGHTIDRNNNLTTANPGVALKAVVTYDKTTNTIKVQLEDPGAPGVAWNFTGGAGQGLGNDRNGICWQFFQVKDNKDIVNIGDPQGYGTGLPPPGLFTDFLIGANLDTYQTSYDLMGARASRNSDMQFLGWDQGVPYNPAVQLPCTWTSWYPVRTRTIDQIYVNCSIQGNNYASVGFSQDYTGQGANLVPSTILAKIPVPPDWTYEPTAKITEKFQAEEVVWDDPNNIFSLTTDQQQLGTVKFWLTDKDGRPLPIFDVNQRKYGNMNCRMTLRWAKLYVPPAVQPATDYVKNPMPDQVYLSGANSDDRYEKRAQLMGHKIV